MIRKDNIDAQDAATGHATPGGKVRRSRMWSAIDVPARETDERYVQLRAELIREFQPAADRESALLAAMADCRWRLERIYHLESLVYESWLGDCDTDDADRHILKALESRGPNLLHVLLRLESAAMRGYYRAHRELVRTRDRVLRRRIREARHWLKTRFDPPPLPGVDDPVWLEQAEPWNPVDPTPAPDAPRDPA